MREYSTPLNTELAVTGSLTDEIRHNAAHHAEVVVFSRRVGDRWVDVTAAQFLQQVRDVAKGLLAAGVELGDRVALLSTTRYEWTLFDYAIWYAGGVGVPIYDTSSIDQVGRILAHSSTKAVVVETRHHIERISLRGRHGPDAADIWCIEAGAVETLSALGRDVSDDDIEMRRAAITPDLPATLIYTSGTTGEPKGCVLTHGNLMFEAATAVKELPELFDTDDAATLLFLPLAHVFARIIQVGAVKARVRLGHTADMKHLFEDLASFQPTFILAVPRVLEKVFNTASQKAAADGRPAVFERAAETAISYSKALDGRGLGVTLRLRHSLFDRLVYRDIRGALGGRCQYAISGGAPLGERLGHFYRGIGLTVLDGFGLTETTGAVTVNLPGALKIGTVGQPLAGTSVRIADDGEVVVRGGQVFAGYWENPVATTDVLSPDGWLHTGDVGEIDDEGFLRITGRKKDIIVTAGGKNVAPNVLEDRVRAHPLVSQCVVVGDGEPFIAALVTIDPDAYHRWAKQNSKREKLHHMTEDPDLRAAVQAAIDEANKAVSQAESIRTFTVLPDDWTEDRGHLTPSLKVKRSAVARQYHREIKALFSN
jgi:long-chain acyl-CoA synthetase